MMGRVLLLGYDFLNQKIKIKSSMEEHGWAYYIKLLLEANQFEVGI